MEYDSEHNGATCCSPAALHRELPMLFRSSKNCRTLSHFLTGTGALVPLTRKKKVEKGPVLKIIKCV